MNNAPLISIPTRIILTLMLLLTSCSSGMVSSDNYNDVDNTENTSASSLAVRGYWDLPIAVFTLNDGDGFVIKKINEIYGEEIFKQATDDQNLTSDISRPPNDDEYAVTVNIDSIPCDDELYYACTEVSTTVIDGSDFVTRAKIVIREDFDVNGINYQLSLAHELMHAWGFPKHIDNPGWLMAFHSSTIKAKSVEEAICRDIGLHERVFYNYGFYADEDICKKYWKAQGSYPSYIF